LAKRKCSWMAILYSKLEERWRLESYLADNCVQLSQKVNGNVWTTLFEQVRVSARAHERDDFVWRLAIKAIYQEEIAPNVAFAMSRPLARQSVIQPLRSQRAVIGDEQYYQFLETL